jgi:chromatin segregation and condensation protein Rec8/ScpA/Scc1 (kleisin family)
MRLLAEMGEIITFSKLVSGLDKIEVIRVFIILLFMAQKGKIILWQHEEFGEIYVTLNGEDGGTLNVGGES